MKKYLLKINEIEINVTQKRMRNILLKVCSPSGEVRISAPLRASQKIIKDFIIKKFSWICEAQNKILTQKKITEKKYINEEKHYFFDVISALEIIEHQGKPHVTFSKNQLKLFIKKDFTTAQRKKLLNEFYRTQLKKIIPHLIKKWEEKMNVKVKEFGIKQMKTRWGTCNTRDHRIWINLELAKKPMACLEYIVVHEMVHLLEKNHSKKFFAYMDKFLPHWRNCKTELKSLH